MDIFVQTSGALNYRRSGASIGPRQPILSVPSVSLSTLLRLPRLLHLAARAHCLDPANGSELQRITGRVLVGRATVGLDIVRRIESEARSARITLRCVGGLERLVGVHLSRRITRHGLS